MTTASDRKQQRREEILAAAQRVFLAKGYNGAGIADIAADLGIGHGTFYRYFKNKHEIAAAVLDKVIERLAAAALAENPESSNSLTEYREQVRRMLTRVVELTAEHPRALPFFQRQGLVIDPERLAQFRATFAAFTARFLVNGVSKEFLRADLDVEATSELLVALVIEGATRAMSVQDKSQALRWMEAGMQLMFDGIASDPR
ncbi:MAG: TetR/AcrR family transcriptional regulator [Myxococcota bacterium]